MTLTRLGGTFILCIAMTGCDTAPPDKGLAAAYFAEQAKKRAAAPKPAPAAPLPSPKPKPAPAPKPEDHALHGAAVAFLATLPDPLPQGDMAKLFKRACRKAGGTHKVTRDYNLKYWADCNETSAGLLVKLDWRDRWSSTNPGKIHRVRFYVKEPGQTRSGHIAAREVSDYVPNAKTARALAKVAPPE